MRGTFVRAVALLLVVAPGVAGAALMHLKLERSEPAANAVLKAPPTTVRLWFTQKPELSVTSIRLRFDGGPSADDRVLTPLSRAAEAGAPITAPLRGGVLAAGRYEIVWRTMARDGHVLNGVIPFEIRPGR